MDKTEEKLLELYGDVKATRTDIRWLKQDSIRRNGIMEDHVKESDKFRRQVTRNTTWRVSHHFAFIIVLGLISFIAWHIFR